jgi:hypothetical protein
MQHNDPCVAFRAFRQAGNRVAVQGIKRAFCLSVLGWDRTVRSRPMTETGMQKARMHERQNK